MLQMILKMICDNNRLRIVNLLKDDSLCVGEIQTILGISQSNTSRHLDKLKMNGLLESNKKAQRIFYNLKRDLLKKFQFFSDLIYKDVLNEEHFIRDLEKLNKYKKSGLTCEDLKKYNFDFNKIKL